MLYSKYILIAVSIFLADCNAKQNKSTHELTSNTQNSKNIPADALVLDQQKGLMFYQDQLFSGTATETYPDHSIASSIDYVNGKKEGHYLKWFNNGKLSYEAKYTNGKQNGKTYTWWRNGNLRTESNFVNGIPDGIQLQYYKSGSLFKKINLEMGQEQGLQQSWRENGKLYNNYEAKHGRIFGLKRSKLCFKLEDENVQS